MHFTIKFVTFFQLFFFFIKSILAPNQNNIFVSKNYCTLQDLTKFGFFAFIFIQPWRFWRLHEKKNVFLRNISMLFRFVRRPLFASPPLVAWAWPFFMHGVLLIQLPWSTTVTFTYNCFKFKISYKASGSTHLNRTEFHALTGYWMRVRRIGNVDSLLLHRRQLLHIPERSSWNSSSSESSKRSSTNDDCRERFCNIYIYRILSWHYNVLFTHARTPKKKNN